MEEKRAISEQPVTLQQPYSMPMTQQPGAQPPPSGGAQQQWMPIPPTIPGCPKGLEYLTQIDQLLIHQQVELFEAITNIEMKNRFQIKNTLGQQCYFAQEESAFCMRYCCGPGRGFLLHILDNAGQEIIRCNRPFKCCSGCCWCATGGHCSYNINVESPVGNLIGQVIQGQSCWVPYYDILDQSGNHIFKIKGPCCVVSGVCCTCDFSFQIYAGDDVESEPVGRIAKQYSGAVKEMFTDATNFSVTFPMDLDVKMKAVLLAATFLIDIMYFERNN